LQIRKYLNGELDAKAMHRLERQAQDDPFLMDALEGYEKAGSSQQKQLNELTARLKNRIEPKKGRIIPLRYLSIAASVLIVCSAGVWWFNSVHTAVSERAKVKVTNLVLSKPKALPRPVDIATTSQAPVKAKKDEIAHAAEKTIVAAQQPEPPAGNAAIAPQQPPSVPVLKEVRIARPQADKVVIQAAPADSTPLNEMIVMQYAAKKKAVDTSLFTRKTPVVKNEYYKSPPLQQLQSKVPGVQIQSNAAKQADLSKLAQSNAGGLAMSQLLASQNIQGRVIARDDGLPIQGASVKVAGTDKVAKTNAQGFFDIKADSNKSKLVITGVGYQSRQVSANVRDSVKNISLEPNSSALSEVIVTGYTSQAKEADETNLVSAHPQNGWSEFKKYLKANANSPDHKTGVVKLSFMIDRFGSISTIKVIKGLSAPTDKKAVDIIKDGPEWAGNSNKKPELVHLRIRFVN